MDLSDKYIEFAEALSELTSLEDRVYSKKIIVEEIKKELKSGESNGSFGLEFTGHAFQQITERLSEIGRKHPQISNDVFKNGDYRESLVFSPNMKSFIITLLSNAHKKGQFKEEESKSSRNTNGSEFRYDIHMKKWSNERALHFIAIVENNYIKTGFFNWV